MNSSFLPCGSLVTCFMCFAVTWELSNFFASWQTVLAGNLFNSTCPSTTGLETKDLSFRKNQNISLCKIWAVAWGYLTRATCVCTVLYHSFTIHSPCLKLVNKSNLALTSLACGLQNSSNLFHMTSNVNSSDGIFQDTYWSRPKSPLPS